MLATTCAEFLREQLAARGRIPMRRVFGKIGVFYESAASSGCPCGAPRRFLLAIQMAEKRATFRAMYLKLAFQLNPGARDSSRRVPLHKLTVSRR
jgi:hypothetical protein